MRGAEEGTRGFVLSGIQGWRNPLDFWDSRAPSFHFSPPKVKEIFKILKIEQTLSFPFILEERGTQDSPCLYPSVSCLLAGVWALSGLVSRETGVGGTDGCLLPSRACRVFIAQNSSLAFCRPGEGRGNLTVCFQDNSRPHLFLFLCTVVLFGEFSEGVRCGLRGSKTTDFLIISPQPGSGRGKG